MADRVVVTGLGAVTPLGRDAESTWQALTLGISGIARITLFDPAGYEVTIAAEVKDFDPGVAMDRKESRHADRFVQFGVVASIEALRHARLTIDDSNRDQIGVIIGSGAGGLTTFSEQFDILRERGPRRVSPFFVPMMLPNMASGRVSIATGARGPNPSIISACSSGADSIGYAAELIRRGDCDAMLAGGAEAPITPIGIAGFASERALSTHNEDPEHASRPFDAERDGFVMGEGAAVMLLESLDHARARGATILAELSGYGATADAYHLTQLPSGGEGAARAMQIALHGAGIEPEQVDYINAHGTSTPMNDRVETEAIKTVFGSRAYDVPISSIKSMTGHLLGASGALEACVSVQVIQRGVIPPTMNYCTPDPDCDLDYTPNKARTVAVSTVLSNSFGFGGHNSALVFRRYRPL
jgi:3-oxoacyl-[acyl-carrier-protein] synthase II